MKRVFPFGDKLYTLSRADLGGYCEDNEPDKSPLEIWVNPRARGRVELEFFIHEALHAEFPQMGENAVQAAGEDIGAWLWQNGYRKRRKGK